MYKVLKNTLLDLCFPFFEECLYCDKSIKRQEENYLCEDCRNLLLPIGDACRQCSYPMNTAAQTRCNDCISLETNLREFHALYLMDEKSLKNIYKYKYHHDKYFAKFYAKLLLNGIIEKYPDFEFDGLAFVPSTKQKIRERGFDHIFEIVKIVASELDIRVFDILERVKHHQSQATLNRKERLTEINNAFVLKKNIKLPKYILLVDDIYTTGATMEEVASVLNNSGISVSGITIFRTMKD